MLATTVFSFAALARFASAHMLDARQNCGENFNICSPEGAITGTLGPINAGWGSLYQNIINVVNGYTIDDSPTTTATVNPDGPARREMGFCCSISSNCLLVKDYGVPMCWDRFTTNVYFPDGTYGSVVSGDFNTSDGDSVNLVYGDYMLKDGSKGNIFSDSAISSIKPDTSTMNRPRPWTSSGVGSAIPATELGASATLSTGTTVVPATTVPASTGESITLIATMTGCANCPPYNTTIPGMLAPTNLGGQASAGSQLKTGLTVIAALVITSASYFY